MFLLMFICLLNPVLKEIHDFHVSRCEINYETGSGDIQIAAHIFIDDLENALKLSGHNDLHLTAVNENSKADQIIERYINSKLKLQAGDGRILKLQMIGKEMSDDEMALWCYLEVTDMKHIHELKIENTILMELFNDQKNIIDFTLNGKKKYFSVLDTKKRFVAYRW